MRKLFGSFIINREIFAFFMVLVCALSVRAEQRNLFFDETVREVGEQVANSVVQLRYLAAARGASSVSDENLITSGWLIDTDGWIVTSDFGLPLESESPGTSLGVVVTFADGSEQIAKLKARDFPRRIALLKTNRPVEKPALEYDLGKVPQPGETAIVIGRGIVSSRINYSIGIVSAIDRFAGRAIQIDANTSASNYGGPLLNLRGEILGIVSPLAPPGQPGEAWYDSGIGFAVPVDAIVKRLPRLQAGENFYTGWAGIQLKGGNPFRAKPYVEQTMGPAAMAGIESGDLITHVSGKPTPTIARLRRELQRHDAGELISLTLLRNDKVVESRMTLTEKPSEPEEAKTKREAIEITPRGAFRPAE